MGIKLLPFIQMGMNNILVLSIHPRLSPFIPINLFAGDGDKKEVKPDSDAAKSDEKK